ncbi:hypothetical protein CU254_40970 (plasmid) [Amycolatopsis sp. AA4]|uniref:hypothetical protein n=1 Tax=Actinomycetes TaxID=1760 RepID=UPI0001B56188|nr:MULTISPECIES: hypothetical protein [Actinomycetes]ATY16967.1 hypothetical protein CU254_40970 [Amycolatopsis sp. AA4]EFL12545.1 predicted protein [Streptomyces sp. AA4]
MRIHWKTCLRASALALAGGAILAPTADAAAGNAPTIHAPAAHPDKYEPESVVTDAKCKGWMNTEKQKYDRWYAQGLVQSWNGQVCHMILERRHDGDPAWTIVSGEHIVHGLGTADKDHTGWYYDDAGYQSRVCIFNESGSNTWKCGKGI